MQLYAGSLISVWNPGRLGWYHVRRFPGPEYFPIDVRILARVIAAYGLEPRRYAQHTYVPQPGARFLLTSGGLTARVSPVCVTLTVRVTPVPAQVFYPRWAKIWPELIR